MSIRRQGYESGHRPKCLVVVDDTAECDRAIYYAGRWAKRAGGGVVMLRLIDTADRNQQWLGVADIMKAEADENAAAALDRAAICIENIAAIGAERVIREGEPQAQILDVIATDTDIAVLVLAACGSPEGPGPIITALTAAAGSFPVPLAIVPGNLSEDDIDALV